MNKRIISLVLTLVICFGCFSAFAFNASAADYTDTNGITYKKEGTGTNAYYSIIDGSKAKGDYSISSTVNDLPVKKILDNAFEANNNITTVTIPSTVTSVGISAFAQCSKLRSVLFDDSVSNVAIKTSAFSDCVALQIIKFPTKYITVTENSFYNCKALTEIVIPEGVITIQKEAFSYCSGLKTVKISSSVSNLEGGAFYNCASITEFIVDSNNEDYKAVNGALYSKDGKTLYQYPLGLSATSYIVPNGVDTIEYGAFSFSKLNTVNLPKSVKTIEDYAFANSDISSISFPESLSRIGVNAFLNCNELKSVTIPANIKKYESAFAQCGLETVTITDGAAEIAANAFNDCKSLKKVIIPSSVSIIKDGAFTDHNGVNLSSVILYVAADSYAEQYAKSNGIKYVAEAIKTYTVTYYDYNSIVYKTYTLEPGDKIPVPANLKDITYNSASEDDLMFVGWDNIPSTMPEKDVSINPQYQVKPYLRPLFQRSFGYKTSVKYYSSVKNPEYGKLYWVVNGKEIADDGTGTHIVKEPAANYTIALRIKTAGRNIDSDKVNITIKSTFISKIVYFFKHLFNSSSLFFDQGANN